MKKLILTFTWWCRTFRSERYYIWLKAVRTKEDGGRGEEEYNGTVQSVERNSRCAVPCLISTDLLNRIPFEGKWCSSCGTRYISSLNREGRACQSLQADKRSPNKSWQYIHRQSRLNCCINPEARVPTQQFNKRRCVPPHRSGKETDLTARGACQCQAREAVSVMGQCVNCFQCRISFSLLQTLSGKKRTLFEVNVGPCKGFSLDLSDSLSCCFCHEMRLHSGQTHVTSKFLPTEETQAKWMTSVTLATQNQHALAFIMSWTLD